MCLRGDIWTSRPFIGSLRLIYLHELKQQAGLDGDGEVVLRGVFARNGSQEGVPDGTRPLHRLLQSRSSPHRAAFDPAALK